MKPVKVSDLIDALQFDSPDILTRVDLQNGTVISVERGLVSAFEEGDADSLDSLPDWQKQEVENARAIAEDPGERFIAVPDKFEFHEYRQMERFIGTVRNSDDAEQLWRSIKGKSAFRYFKDTASRLGLLDQWYQYRDDALKEFIVDWAKAKGVPLIDDTNK